MENGRLHRFMSKHATAWSKQTLPGWWTMFTVACGLALFVYFAYSMVSGDPEKSNGRDWARDPASTASTGPVDAPDATPTTRPSDPDPDASEPAEPSGGQVSVPAGAGEKSVKVYGPGGEPVAAPAGAASVASLAFQALYDEQAAVRVPTASGAAHQPPAAPARGKFTGLTLTDAGSGDRLKFSAVVDPDAAGPIQPTVAYATIARIDGFWVYLDTAG